MFIVFEGVDGCGKSTQIKKLYQYLINHKYDVVLTREPGGTFSGELIRELFLTNNFDQELQYLLMLASRAEHIDSVILPALKENKIILSDRYGDSTNVYQAIDNSNLNWIANKLIKNILPDLTLIFTIDSKEALRRIKKRFTNKMDVFEEQLSESVIEKRQQKYLQIASQNKSKYIIIDANKSVAEIHENIIAIVENILNG